jgi:hypothetical protein
MENIPPLNSKNRYACRIEASPYLYDHYFEGKVILPAVETLINIAKAVKINFPQTDITCMQIARFPKFLSIAADTRFIPALIDIEKKEKGIVTTSLLTAARSKTGLISRYLEHARVDFVAVENEAHPAPPNYIIQELQGKSINVPSAAIYRELVPFGRAYQNITGDLIVASDGALANLSGGDCDVDEETLGSPFPLDAALHAACVWGQRYTDIVAFPVGFEKRIIYHKTTRRGSYIGRIIPVDVSGKTLIYDALIYDLNGMIYEMISGIQMRDVSDGHHHPPRWIRE